MIAKIVGWSAGTLAKMAARYGHFGLEEMRAAMERLGPEADSDYPKKSPKSTETQTDQIQ